jgi:hypothetical protein
METVPPLAGERGEREKGRKGEREKGRKGEREKGSRGMRDERPEQRIRTNSDHRSFWWSVFSRGAESPVFPEDFQGSITSCG